MLFLRGCLEMIPASETKEWGFFVMTEHTEPLTGRGGSGCGCGLFSFTVCMDSEVVLGIPLLLDVATTEEKLSLF